MDSSLVSDVSRRSFLKLVIAAGGSAAVAGALPRNAAAEEAAAGTDYPEKFTFAVMSDIHYFSPDLYGDNADYTTAENSDRKMFRESSDILDKALEDIVAAQPDMVIVPGDLTKDGELICHEQVAAKFEAAREQLAAAGVDTQFYVINGNHDLNNHNGKDFSSGAAQDARRTDPATYKSEIWTACGYTDTTVYDFDGTADGSLSYVAHPCPGLTLIVVDTCKYNVVADDGTLAQETSGHISSDLLTWVCDQAKQARASGDVVVAMQHHGIVPHFGYEPVVFGEYLVDDYEAVARAYAEAGIAAVFTGHMHANDIAAATYGDATIYDIETGSLVTYPSRMRMGSFAFEQDGDEVTCTLTVDSHDLGQVTLDECGLTAGTQNITAYGKERTLTVTSIQTMLGGMFVEPLLTEYAPQGIRAILASVLPALGGDDFADVTADTVNDALWNLITTQLLPSDPNTGSIVNIEMLGLNLVIYFNAQTGRIEASLYTETGDQESIVLTLPPEIEAEVEDELAQHPSALAIEPNMCVLYIDQAHFVNFLNELYDEIDAKALDDNGVATMLQIVDSLVELLLAADVDETPHSLLELVDFAYQGHLMGCEAPEAWATAATNAVPTLLPSVVAESVNNELKSNEFTDFVTNITIDMNTLLDGDADWLTTIAIMAIANMVPNVAGLLDLVGDYAGINLGEALAGIVTDLELMGEPVSTLAQNTLSTLMNDDNINGSDPNMTDHDFTVSASTTIASGGDDGNDDNDGTGDDGAGGDADNDGAGDVNGGTAGGVGGGSNGGSGSAGGSGANAGNASTGNNATGGSLPQTGDVSMVVPVAATVIGGGLVAAGVGLKRKR